MMSEPYGHVFSTKSKLLNRDTFIFGAAHGKSRLFFGVNQRLTPMTMSTFCHWIQIMTNRIELEKFFLCPVVVQPAGIMSYFVRPSGPAIDPESAEPIPPGNYGWYCDAACNSRGVPEVTMVPQRQCTFQDHFDEDWLGPQRAIMDTVPPPVEKSATARDGPHFRFTTSVEDLALAWIIPPVLARETDDWGFNTDPTPFLVSANALTMQSDLVFHFHSNHFTVDPDDDYRILIFYDVVGLQRILPTYLPRHPQQDVAADEFLRLHCRYSLSVMIRGGDISEVYSNWSILAAMDELGVVDSGNGYREEREMAPLSDERWQTELGQAILAHIMRSGLHGLDKPGRLVSKSTSPPVPVSRLPSPDCDSNHNDRHGPERNEAALLHDH
ncbi:hypothetical protein DFH08DRAFT_84887 [Mycena albidolilacea]|uniref:HNH nuclease domain-containing protein n=1 Tax=Mycena albidolilacea TaxID=1033008 RepID=A0AAD7EW29_9AGAR|nr:hypothetical protein DFH08DRAFT_84887 [Mycena albidolilacea]